MNKIRLLTAFVLLGSLSFAQDEAPSKDYVGLQFGSMGIGGHYVHSLNSRWNLRFSGSFFQASLDKTVETSRYTEQRTYNGRVGGIGALADYDLSANTPNWKVSMGLFYQFNNVNQLSSFSTVLEGETIDLGTLDLTFTAFPVNPYAGLVFGNFKSDKKVFITLELGTLFHGKPNVEFDGTGIIRFTGETNEQRVKDNVSNYNWFPYGNFQINYRLK